MKVVIGCGGTGGHITPALAIADIIKERCPAAKLLFLGASGGMEEELVTRAGYPIRCLRIMGLSRTASVSNVKALYLALKAAREAEQLLAEFDPDIVIGTGGYASYPALQAAIRKGIPCAVHESNAVPGLTVKRLAARVDRVWLNFDKAALALPKSARVLTVGNPTLRGCSVPSPVPLPQGRTHMVLSFGGSLGAKAVNRAVLDMMEWERTQDGIYHLHATGKREYEEVKASFAARGLDHALQLALAPFLTPMPAYMAAADVVISRAGAMSISELAALGKAAILIPSPNVTGNHQYKNARALSDRGAAILIEEKDLAGELLYQTVRELLSNAEKRKAMERAVKAFHRPHCNEEIWEDICKLCREKGQKRC